MRSSHPLRVFVTLVSLALAASCGDSTSPDPNAVALNEALAMSAMSLRASGSAGALGATSPVPALTASSCSYESGTQRFVCPTVTANGVTLTVYYQLLDAGGGLQSAFDRTTTASIFMVRDLTGTITTSQGQVAVSEHHEQTLSGLLTDTRVLNGTGSGTATASSLGVTFTMTETITNVVFPPRGSPTPYPLSGTITVVVDSPLPTGDTTVTMTFNGTAIVSVEFTGTINQDCTLDLSKPASNLVCA